MEYIASLSYGKDSLAMLEAIKILGLPLDRIVTAEVWATETIPADFPEMVEFKKKADQIILDRYGIQVEHFRADMTYEQGLYHTIKPETIQRRKELGKKKSKYLQHDDERTIWGFPIVRGSWCNSKLKMAALQKAQKETKDAIQYVGIAADEPERIARHQKKENVVMPLVEIGWDEAYCRKWCEENDLLSPIYATAERGGCWFCHNQKLDQLRLLRKNHPDLWQMLLLWDLDSPTTFRADGHTIHDLDKRFDYEEKGLVPSDRKFRWKMMGD